jgi:hypothetical protein
MDMSEELLASESSGGLSREAVRQPVREASDTVTIDADELEPVEDDDEATMPMQSPPTGPGAASPVDDPEFQTRLPSDD